MTLVQLSAVLAAVVSLVAIRWASSRVPTSAPAPVETVERRDRSDDEVPDTIALVVGGGTRFAGDAHDRLRPLLREIAATRLSRRGVQLDREHDQGEIVRLLGPALSDLLRADRPRPLDPFATGVSLAELDAHLDRLEAL